MFISCSHHTVLPSPGPAPASSAGVWLGNQGPILLNNSPSHTHTQWNDHLADEAAGWAAPCFDRSKTRQTWTASLAAVGPPSPA